MIFYVNGHHFNLDKRRPLVRLAENTMVPWVHYSLLQSDVVTILSSMIAVLRLVTACWLGPLCWRCAFVLMEEFGLRPKQLRNLILFNVTTVPPSRTVKKRWFLRFLIPTILFIVLPAQLAAPVLTGSITWVPSNPPTERLSNQTLFPFFTPDYDGWNSLITSPWFPNRFEQWTAIAANRAFLAWGRETPNVALKRFVSLFSGLEVNSTVDNVVIPYFAVQAIEWIDNPDSTLSSDQVSVMSQMCPRLNMTNTTACLVDGAGALALIPDTPWTSEPSQSPSIVTERRLMVYQPNSMLGSGDNCSAGGELTPDVTGHIEADACWKFAWVTYSAGAVTCKNCRVSSYATVQNDTMLVPQEAYMTAEALRMMPAVTYQMVMGYESTDTAPKWENVNDYVIGRLTRSYAGAWMALTDRTNNSRSLARMTYSVSPGATQALVNLLRVYIWLALQSLITLSGALFIFIQVQSSSPLIGNTTLAAFHLDSSALHDGSAYNKLWGGSARRVELEGDRLFVKVE